MKRKTQHRIKVKPKKKYFDFILRTNLKYFFIDNIIFSVINDKEISTENHLEKEKSRKGHFVKMLPNPEVGVPFILAYDKFNKEIKKLEELQQQGLSKA